MAIDTHWVNVRPMSWSQKIWKDFTTLAQRWPNVVPPTNIGNRMRMSQVDIGPIMGQRCVPNSNGPTITQRWPNVCILSGY